MKLIIDNANIDEIRSMYEDVYKRQDEDELRAVFLCSRHIAAIRMVWRDSNG